MQVKWMIGILAACVLFSGCSAEGKKENEDYKKIVDDFAGITLQQDRDNGAYEKALEAVGAYLEASNGETLKEAQTAVHEIMEQMEADSSSCVPYEMDEEFSKLLAEYGLDPEEYRINADMRSGYLAGYISSLSYLSYYLEHEGAGSVTGDSLKFTYQYDIEEQENTRGFYSSGINYWFAEWGEEETAYVKEQVLDKMEHLLVEGLVWENSREAVERRLNVYLDTMEENMDNWLEFIGENQEELYKMEMELGK